MMGIRNLFGRTRRSARRNHGALRRRNVRTAEALEQRVMLVGEVVINEIHYNPDVETQLVEFIELYNTSAASIDLSNWSFSQGVDYVFPVEATIAPNNYYVIAENAAQFQSKFGFAPNGVYLGNLQAEGENVRLKNAADVIEDEVDYKLGFPWPTVGDAVGLPGNGRSIQLINPALQNEVGGSWRSGVPTPRAQNSGFAANAPPQMRQVNHIYSTVGAEYARPGDTVTINVRVSDPNGVQGVALQYQIVEPGQYIEIATPAYQTQWTSVAMLDDGLNGDIQSGDGIYTVQLPASLQQHRRLIRYRITSTDTLGASITGPYADDPQPNFAYYVYGDMPSWTGAVRPGVTPPVTYNASLLQTLPAYHLITTRNDHEDSQAIPNGDQGQYGGSDYLWQGALVFNGEVYDHIRYRARGGVWRYAMGKNMWKFDFNRGHLFEPVDDYGVPYDVKWKKLNFSAVIQQGDFQHRGEQGLFESVGFKLFNLAGSEAPNTSFAHFRIVENANEHGANQYGGDFQGMYLAVEQPDGQLLQQHGLPDGNFYKMEGGTGELNNQGPTQPSNKSDLNLFQQTYINTTPTDQWWRDNVDLDSYYSYRAIVEAIHHYDIDESAGKNYFYFHNPETGKWSQHAWDLDLTWANNMYGGGDDPFRDRVLPRPAFAVEYRNRVREIRDLLYNSEQTGLLIDEMASFIYTPGRPSWVDADRAMWDYNPILASGYVLPSKAGHGRFYQVAATDDFPGMMQLMKNYVVSRGQFIDTTILTDENLIPQRPTINYTGAANHPADGLTFTNSGFSSGSSAFKALEWRIAEVNDPPNPNYDPLAPRAYEITPAWESGALTTFSSNMTIPGDNLSPGQTYRVRVRYQDQAGRWSHWSNPSQFIVDPPLVPVHEKIRVTELNYHPSAPTAAEIAAGFTDPDAFEFIELQNISAQNVNLGGYRFTDGVQFTFPPVNVAPGERVVVVNDERGFQFRYGFGHTIAGEFSDGKFDNGGEQVVLATGGSQTIVKFVYDDIWHAATDGGGPTLVILNPTASLEIDPVTGQSASWSRANSWRASTNPYGSPGIADPAAGQSPPPNPTGLTASSPLWSQVSLDWNDTAGETGYKIERKTGTAGPWSQVAEAAADVTTFLDTSLTAATQYFYRVRAFNTAGSSLGTNPIGVTTALPPLPGAPTNLTADSPAPGRIDLVWTDNSTEEVTFTVERKLGVGGVWGVVATLDLNSVSYIDRGLAPDTTYHYRVKANNAAGSSGYSNQANATTAATIAGLAGHYHFDEPSGNTTMLDSSGLGNDGSLVGGTQQIVGTSGAQAGNALNFDGMNDHVLLNQTLSGVLGGTATLATWIRTTQIGSNIFWQAPGITGVEEAGGGNDIFWGWIDGAGRIGIGAGNGASAMSANPINDNNWHHVAFTRDAGTGFVRVFVDGQLAGSTLSEQGLKSTPFRRLGSIEDTGGTHTYFAGLLDELQIFNRVLSQAEIQALRFVNVVHTGTAGDDIFTVNRSTSNGYIRIYPNQPPTGVPSYAIQPSVLGVLQIDGLSGNDAVTIAINGTAGFPIQPAGFVFNGGDGNDSLSVQGNTTSATIPLAYHGGEGANTATITAGLVSMDADAAGGTLNTIVQGGALLTTNRFNQNGLTLTGAGTKAIVRPGGALANVLTTFSLGAGTNLELTDNDLIVRANEASVETLYAALRGQITSAQNGLDANFLTRWDGSGLTSSTARATNLATGFDLVGLGLIRNSDLDITTGLPGSAYTSFGGVAVGPHDLLVKHTYIGDGNLDGVVSFDDYVGMDNAFFGLIPNLGWATGDINSDNVINFDDYSVVDQAFFFQGTPLGSGMEEAPAAVGGLDGAFSTETKLTESGAARALSTPDGEQAAEQPFRPRAGTGASNVSSGGSPWIDPPALHAADSLADARLATTRRSNSRDLWDTALLTALD